MRRELALALICVAAAGVPLSSARRADATIVERVVAVIGERPVLWTELLKRAAASRIQIRMQTRDPNIVSVQEQEMYKELLEKMIDDRLEEQQADRAHITVTTEEVDRGIANIAAQAQAQQGGHPVTSEDVIAEVRRRGLTEQDFRDEIRRQIVEGKLIELRVRPRVRVTDQDAHAAYRHWAQELADQQPIDVRILVKRIPAGATATQYQAISSLAQQISQWAQAGQDFCQLVSQYSDDTPTRSTCGSHGAQPMGALLPAIQNAVHGMKPGTVSDPLAVQSGADEALLILMPMGAAGTPPFEQVKNEMMQRALLEGLERARKQWLQELRQKVYIDVRL